MSSHFIVVATLTDSTPFEVLYGQERVLFEDRADAEKAVASFNADALWGPRGDLTPAQAGFTYEVREVDAEDLEPGGEFSAWAG